MTRLFFVRHADAYDVDTGLQLENYPLNNFGRIQALQLAKRLRDNKFDAMYCSKIRRAMETCAIVNEVHQNEIIFSTGLNEVGSAEWPQPGGLTKPVVLQDFQETAKHIHRTYKKICKRHPQQEVILFTHGNWIRVLLSIILSKGNPDPESFVHFVIHNTSLTIIDVGDDGFEYVISVSDAAHTRLYDTHI